MQYQIMCIKNTGASIIKLQKLILYNNYIPAFKKMKMVKYTEVKNWIKLDMKIVINKYSIV